MSWQASIEADGSRHVVPLNDLRPHDLSGQCWCDPADDGGLTVHNSMDGREYFERGERKAS